MLRQMLVGEALELRIDNEDGVACLSVLATEHPGRSATGKVNLSNLLSVLSGTRLHLSIGGWLCSFERADARKSIQATIVLEDLTEVCGYWSAVEFEHFIKAGMAHSPHQSVSVGDPRISLL